MGRDSVLAAVYSQMQRDNPRITVRHLLPGYEHGAYYDIGIFHAFAYRRACTLAGLHPIWQQQQRHSNKKLANIHDGAVFRKLFLGYRRGLEVQQDCNTEQIEWSVDV